MSIDNVIRRGKTVGDYYQEMTIKKKIQEKANLKENEVSKTLVKH